MRKLGNMSTADAKRYVIYPYVRKRRNSDKILSFRTNPTKLCMLQLLINIFEPI